ncbi:MAG: hypothetical protein ACKOSS_06300 [Planctomycetia bacterium]
MRIVDQSASMGPPSGGPGLTLSGGQAGPWLAVADGHAWREPGQARPALPGGETRLGAALAEVALRHPGADVLLESDGRPTDDALAGAAAVRAAGGRLWVRPPAGAAADTGLLEARARRAGAGVEVEARVESSVRGALRLVLEREGAALAVRELAVVPGGAQQVRFEGLPAGDLPARFTLRLQPLAGTPDDAAGNNLLEVPCAADARSVAVVGDLDVAALARALPGVVVRSAATAEQAAVSGADLVVLAGLPWAALGVPGVRALEAAVVQGSHLLLLGGPRGYARGGWGGTALEQRLAPLRCVAPPSGPVAWVLALDASGSTAGAPARALAQAALEALAALQPGERLAVLPFRAASVAAPLAPGWLDAGAPAAREALRTALEALPAQGPTDLRAGVTGAIDLLAAQPEGTTRALVLLTDGDPDERPDAQALAGLRERLAAAGVRFSALVVGMPGTVQALRAGVAQRPEHVQLLGGSEALVAQLLERLARERAALEQEALGSGWSAQPGPGPQAAALVALGELEGLHAVELAPGARLVAVAQQAGAASAAQGVRPLAAGLTLGSGRVHALAWGPGSSAGPSAAAARLAPLVGLLAQEAERGLEAELAPDGGLRVAWPEGRGLGSATLGLDASAFPLLEVAPGLYAGAWPAGLPAASDGMGATARLVAGGMERALRWPSRPAAEHRGVGVDVAALERLARAGGGGLLRAGAEPQAPAQGRGLPTPTLWLGLAATLLLVERALAWRRAPGSDREAA